MEIQQKAAIYIRTSSEAQGEGASPTEQENDCQLLAKENGLIVVHLYRDTKKYRVKNKLVEPSGLRSDRPGLLAMLEDASRRDFDMIIAWREDRLYRGLRSMLMVLEVIQRYKITIMLAKETFDPKIAPVRAWAAQMELENMQERMTMGVIARLKAGKANTGQNRYGYTRIGENIQVVEEEAKWVRKIFAWYTQGNSLSQIRNQLIDANAPQKECTIPRHIQWSRSSIQAILGSAKEYAYGLKTYSRAGQIFHVPVAPIIDMPTYELFVKMREENKTYSKHHKKNDYLLSGHLKCACNLTWRARTVVHRRSRKGEWVERKTPISTYFCPQPHKELRSLDCPKSMNAQDAEAQVWEKLYDFVMNPDFLLAQAKDLVHQLQQNYGFLQQVQKELLQELEKQSHKRQQVITDARKAQRDDDEFAEQMRELYGKEGRLKSKLATVEQELKTYTDLDWHTKVNDYVTNLQAGIEELNNANPESPDDRHRIFLLKKQLVDELLAEATIDSERNIQVEFRAKIIDLAVNKEILKFPNSGEIVARL
jgi:DNA invertase Pin-like site-specific DNA recombinase